MAVNLGLAHEGRNSGWGCSRIGPWEGYLDTRGLRWHRTGENCLTMSFMICTFQQRVFRWSNEEECDGRSCGTWGERHTVFRRGDLRKKEPLGRPGPGLENDTKWILQTSFGRVRIGLIWLRVETGGGLTSRGHIRFFRRSLVCGAGEVNVVGVGGFPSSIYT